MTFANDAALTPGREGAAFPAFEFPTPSGSQRFLHACPSRSDRGRKQGGKAGRIGRKGYRLFWTSSETFRMLCCTHIFCCSSSRSRCSRSSISAFSSISLWAISRVLQPGPTPLVREGRQRRGENNVCKRAVPLSVYQGDSEPIKDTAISATHNIQPNYGILQQRPCAVGEVRRVVLKDRAPSTAAPV